jgi:hypothetical protein
VSVRGAIFKRHEVVFYAVALRDDGSATTQKLVEVLNGTVNSERIFKLNSKDALYMERVSQAAQHRADDLARARKMAEARALEFFHMEIG